MVKQINTGTIPDGTGLFIRLATLVTVRQLDWLIDSYKFAQSKTVDSDASWIRSQQLLFVQQRQTSLNDVTRSESSVPIRNCLLERRPFIQAQLKDRYQSSIGLWKVRLFKSESLEERTAHPSTSRNTATNPELRRQRVHGRPQRWWNHVGSHRTFRSARGRDDPFLLQF